MPFLYASNSSPRIPSTGTLAHVRNDPFLNAIHLNVSLSVNVRVSMVYKYKILASVTVLQ